MTKFYAVSCPGAGVARGQNYPGCILRLPILLNGYGAGPPEMKRIPVLSNPVSFTLVNLPQGFKWVINIRFVGPDPNFLSDRLISMKWMRSDPMERVLLDPIVLIESMLW